MLSNLLRGLLPVLAVAQSSQSTGSGRASSDGLDQPTTASPPPAALFPYNATHCLTSAAGRPGAVDVCGAFSDFVDGLLTVSPAACIGNATADAYACLLQSRCLAAYDVAACAGPSGFDYRNGGFFNFTDCEALVAQENATLGGVLAYAPGFGCDFLLLSDDGGGDGLSGVGGPSEYYDPWAARANAPSLPPLPRFHPCAGMLEGPIAERIHTLSLRAGHYTTHNVLGLSPSIGPVAGGVSIGVCGLGFTMANEAVGHLACKFTDGRNEVAVAAAWVDVNQLRCDAPDFSRFAVGLPHNVSVEISTNRGGTWTENKAQFTYYSTRPAIDAFGRPMWGYESTFTKAAWQVSYEANEYGSSVPALYSPVGHPLNRGKPNEWDSYRDPFHALGESAQWRPVELDTASRFEPASDVAVRAQHAAEHGVEGSWGDRVSFLRAHHLVPDVYRQDIVAARARLREEIPYVNNGLI